MPVKFTLEGKHMKNTVDYMADVIKNTLLMAKKHHNLVMKFTEMTTFFKIRTFLCL